ncbi:hypothetical protein SESBI_48851 [Sesbania bispinosa]|nr:hypothetical protein SESBI_48851 [Sesbania bispinosa]
MPSVFERLAKHMGVMDASINVAWVVIGDFNAYAYEEKFGGVAPNYRTMTQFRNVILNGDFLTWVS